MITLIICATAVTIVIAVAVLGGLFVTDSKGVCSFDKWIEARLAVAKERYAVKRIEAEHMKKCPRLTDPPRGGSAWVNDVLDRVRED